MSGGTPDFAPLTVADLPEAFALSGQVGWNQTEADWRRLLELNPGGGTGVRIDGELVGTSTVMRYRDRLSWIGMVIVAERQRGKGLGKLALDRALELAAGTPDSVTPGYATGDYPTSGADTSGSVNPAAAIGLDATELGEPLYRSRGFAVIRPIERWVGSLPPTRPRAGLALDSQQPAEPATSADLPEIVRYDQAATGVDRSLLIRRLLAEEGVSGWVMRSGSAVTGYALLRPGRRYWQLGPLLADGRDELVALLDSASLQLAGAPVLMDVLDDGDTSDLLERAGLVAQRRLLRMTVAGRSPALTGKSVRMAAGLELG